MSVEIYNKLITKTFRDDAIRSVMMIDDEFLPYDELVTQLTNNTLSPQQISGATRAANLHSFFQKQKKIICDVDTGTTHLDVNKIRKSDLIILDYELEHKNPERSIKLINDLRNSAHMNLVVLYTQERELNTVWLRIASSLRGSSLPEDMLGTDENTKKIWDEKTEYVGAIPQDWLNVITEEDLTNYILGNQISKETLKYFGDAYKSSGKAICNAVCESRIKRVNNIEIPKSNVPIIGENNSVKWLQSGNMFVVLHNKSSGVNESEDLWHALNTALQQWQPSYYRLLISEMQNLLENESVSFDATLKSDLEGQAAWLHKVVSETDQNKKNDSIAQLLDRLTDELKIKIIENNPLKNTINDTFAALSNIAIADAEKNLLEKTEAKANLKIAENIKAATEKESQAAIESKATAEADAKKLESEVKISLEKTKAVSGAVAKALEKISATTEAITSATEAISLVMNMSHAEIEARAKITSEAKDRAAEDVKAKADAVKIAQENAKIAIATADKAAEKDKFSLLTFSAAHVKAKAPNKVQFETDMLHALNTDLCLRSFSGGYVTSGTVLKDITNDSRWFLCVSPACETVPEQHTGGEPTRRLIPHRLIKLIILEECKQIKSALEKAEDGRHIFVNEQNGKRRAFAVQSGDAHQPIIDFAVVHEHDNSHQKQIHKNGIDVSFLGVNPRKKKLFANKSTLIPVAQLRDSYAARFQTVASQHAGRVGVDFINTPQTTRDQEAALKEKLGNEYDNWKRYRNDKSFNYLFQSASNYISRLENTDAVQN